MSGSRIKITGTRCGRKPRENGLNRIAVQHERKKKDLGVESLTQLGVVPSHESNIALIDLTSFSSVLPFIFLCV